MPTVTFFYHHWKRKKQNTLFLLSMSDTTFRDKNQHAHHVQKHVLEVKNNMSDIMQCFYF